MEPFSYTGQHVPPDPLLQFVQRVVPVVPGTYVNIHGAGGDTKFKKGGHAFVVPDELSQLKQFAEWLTSKRADTFYCLSAQSKFEKMKQRAREAARGRENAAWVRSFIIDLDVKAKGYPDQRAALKAGLTFCQALGLTPGYILSSGNGVHIIIVLTEAILPHVWDPLARRLQAAAIKHQLKFDAGVTVNPATLLRLPTGMNHKDPANPKPVFVMPNGIGPDMTLADFEKAVAPYQPASTPGVKPSETVEGLRKFLDIHGRGGAPITSGPVFDEVSAARENNRIDTTVDHLRAACPVFADSSRRAGDGDIEPLWKEIARLCTHIPDGRKHFHDMSRGDDRYTEEETDRKYSEQLEKQGWSHCSTIAASCQAAAALCAGCQFNGRALTPVHASAELTAMQMGQQPTAPAIPVNPFNMAVPAPSQQRFDYPKNLMSIDARGWLIYDDGKPVFKWPIVDMEYHYGEGVAVSFPVHTHVNGNGAAEIDTIIISEADLASDQALKARLGTKLPIDNPKTTTKAIMDWTTFIRTQREFHRDRRPGWRKFDGQIKGFNFGQSTYDEDYRPIGTLTAWAQTVAPFIVVPEISVIVAAAFAAPLVELLQVDGCWIHFVSTSGAGKSLAMSLGASVWGHPMNTVQRSATSNASMARSAETNNLPVYLDETITAGSKNAKQNQNLARDVLRRMEGQDKDRLSGGRGHGLVRGKRWRTLTCSAANFGLVEAATAGDTNAQAARLFELQMAMADLDLGSKAADIRTTLETNYGQAGLVYAEYLNKNFDAVRVMVKLAYDTFKAKAKLTDAARYWLATAATIYIGAKIAVHLGILPFNTEALFIYLLDNLKGQQTQMKEMNVDPTDPTVQIGRVLDFVNTHRTSIIVTDNIPRRGGGKLNFDVRNILSLTYTKEFVGRMAVLDYHLDLSVRAMKEWCAQQGFSFNDMKRTLVKAGLCVAPDGHPIALARGTTLTMKTKEYVLQFDLRHNVNSALLAIAEGDDDVRPTVPSGEDPRPQA